MKKTIILCVLLMTGIATFAQQASAIKTASPNQTVQKQDTLFTLKLNKPAIQVLLSTIQASATLIRRSPDVSALQADEMVKNISELGTEIYKQIKPFLADGADVAEDKRRSPLNVKP